MIPKLIHLKVLRTKASPTASSELPRPLTAYERKCLTDLERAGKVLPEELDLLAEGHEEPYDLDTLSQGMFAYLNFAARYANSFEWFRFLELSDRTRLMKTLYTALLSVRFAYNFDGDVHRIPCLSVMCQHYNIDQPCPLTFVPPCQGDDGVKCQRMDWVQVLYMNTKEDDIVEALKESMFQMSSRVNKDRTIRNLVSCSLLISVLVIVMIMSMQMQMVLFTQSNQPVTCPQYLHYHHTFYLTLLRRYLQHKHRSTPKATEEYWHVYKIIELYHQRRVVADQLISKLDCSKMPHLLSEIYDLA